MLTLNNERDFSKYKLENDLIWLNKKIEYNENLKQKMQESLFGPRNEI